MIILLAAVGFAVWYSYEKSKKNGRDEDEHQIRTSVAFTMETEPEVFTDDLYMIQEGKCVDHDSGSMLAVNPTYMLSDGTLRTSVSRFRWQNKD